jgi:hypothetical protein
MDKHIGTLCKKHLETKFVRVSGPHVEEEPGTAMPSIRHCKKHSPHKLMAACSIVLCMQINAEKSPFLTERLKIWMLPTLALIKNEKVEDYVVGFQVRAHIVHGMRGYV